VGTDHGLYVSVNRGLDFMPMDEGLPAVPIHDVVVHPRENELIVGTHGRSLYLTDVSYLQKMDQTVLDKELFAFDIEKVKYRDAWGDKRRTWSEEFSQPEIDLVLYAKNKGNLTVSIKLDDVLLKQWVETIDAGLNYLEYNADVDNKRIANYEKHLNKNKEQKEDKLLLENGENGKYYLLPGTYSVEFEKDGNVIKANLLIEDK
jgi:hypothetical protein